MKGLGTLNSIIMGRTSNHAKLSVSSESLWAAARFLFRLLINGRRYR